MDDGLICESTQEQPTNMGIVIFYELRHISACMHVIDCEEQVDLNLITLRTLKESLKAEKGEQKLICNTIIINYIIIIITVRTKQCSLYMKS